MRTRGNVFGAKNYDLINKYNTKYSYLLPKHRPQWLPFYYWYWLKELNINSAKNNMANKYNSIKEEMEEEEKAQIQQEQQQDQVIKNPMDTLISNLDETYNTDNNNYNGKHLILDKNKGLIPMLWIMIA